MSANTLEKMSPAEIDGELSRIYAKAAPVHARIAGYRRSIYDVETDKFSRAGRRARNKAGELTASALESLAHLREEIERYQTKIDELDAEAAPFDAEFERRGRWFRYFLVTSSDGHVHRGMNCSTCWPTTEYVWLVELADKSAEAMVERYGIKACTVCFPDAPTLPGWAKSEKAAEAEAAEKAKVFCSHKSPARTEGDRYPRRYANCPECGARAVSVTSLGALRKHKRPVAKK